MSDSERTEQEREQARLAREGRRRKGAGGSASSPAPQPAAPPPAPPPLRIEAPTPSAPRRVTPRAAKAGRPPRQPRQPRQPHSTSRAQTGRAGARRPRRRGGVARLRLILLGVFVVLLLGVLWFLASLFQPLGGAGTGSVRVVIPRDSSSAAVGNLLEHDGVISSSFFFKLRVDLSGSHFDAGSYRLARGMSYGAALARLSAGPTMAPTEDVTIIPGKSRYQLDRLLRSERVKGSYMNATRRSPLLNPALYGAPRSTPSLEGFLYPDTYQVRKPLSLTALVADQLIRFKQEMARVNLGYAKSKHLSAYDVLKIASLEDAEAALPSDLPKVASVIYNRLRLGMDLGLDTTAAYASNNYGGNLSTAQLNSSSPWNTLNHSGLPPTPIDSPDLAAIQAAAHPASTPYLYFIVKVCGNGALDFSADYEQFLIWSRQYATSLAKQGAQKTEFCKHRG